MFEQQLNEIDHRATFVAVQHPPVSDPLDLIMVETVRLQAVGRWIIRFAGEVRRSRIERSRYAMHSRGTRTDAGFQFPYRWLGKPRAGSELPLGQSLRLPPLSNAQAYPHSTILFVLE